MSRKAKRLTDIAKTAVWGGEYNAARVIKPEDTRFRERKLHDMTLRLDSLYDIIVELEGKIEDV